MNAKLLAPIILPLGLALAACGGGSSTNDASPKAPTEQPSNGNGNGGGNSGNGNGNGGNTGTDNPDTGTDNPDTGGTGSDPVDTTAPTVVTTVPVEGSETASITGSMSVSFNETLEPTTVNETSVTLTGPSGNVAVDVSINDANVTIMPRTSLQGGASYTATLTQAITDLAGNSLAEDFSWQFKVSNDLCAGFYSSNFTLVQGKDTSSPRSGFSLPAKGKRYADPAYGSCVVRATDHEAEGLPGFARNDYSRRQPFNADDSHFLIYSRDGNWHLYKTSDMSHVRQLALGGGSVEPQWHPTNPDILYLFPNNGGMTISTFNVKTSEKKVVADFRSVASIAGHPGATSINAIWPSAARIWTKSEGSPSADARYWGLQVETSDFKSIGMITFDLQNNAITGVFDFAKDGGGIGRPDHISMSATGDYVVPSWNATGMNCPSRSELGTRNNPCGLMAYKRDFSSAVGLTVRGPHSDVGLDANGRDIIVAGDYDSGWVEMWDLATGQATKLWQIYENGNSTAMHLSTKNFAKPGWVLISTYLEKAPGWYANKIMAVELKANPRILNIAHSYNKVETYFSETHAAVNRDFTRILFNSNWNTADMLNIDAYMITLPPTAVPAQN